MASSKKKPKSDNSVTQSVLAAALVALFVGGSSPWWWSELKSMWPRSDKPMLSENAPASQSAAGPNGDTSITCTSAKLNGYVTPNGVQTSAWFERGTTLDLGKETPHQAFLRASPFTDSLTVLTEKTHYYFRAVATNNFGTVIGKIRTFSTPPC